MLKAQAAIPPNKTAINISGQAGDAIRVSIDIYLTRPEQLIELQSLVGDSFWILMSKDNFELNN